MASFYYCIDAKQIDVVVNGSLNAELIENLGLTNQFRTAMHVPMQCIVSNSKLGTVLYPHTVPTDKSDPVIVGFDETRQQWMQTENYWLGWVTGDEPTPHDLQHSTQTVNSYPCEDAFGNMWSIPIIRSPQSSRDATERVVTFDRNLQPTETVAPHEQALWDFAGDCIDHINGTSENEEPELVDLALKALAFMQKIYRIGPAEIAAFQKMGRDILQKDFVYRVIYFACDCPLRDELKKKETAPKLGVAG